MALSELLLIRHARPAVNPAVPARDWPLTEEGHNDAVRLAEILQPLGPRAIVASDEIKAVQTAKPLGFAWGLEVAIDRRLREVDRPWVEGDMKACIKDYLNGKIPEGWEGPVTVRSRLSFAIEHHGGPEGLVVVGHGTSLTLLACDLVPLADPFALWEELRMPDAVVVDVKGKSVHRL